MAKKKKTSTGTKKKTSNSLAAIRGFLKNKTNHTVFGIVLIFIAVFLFGALTSYLFNWQADQSNLRGGFFELLGRDDYKVKNILGKLGAAISHQFIYNWFGVAAYLTPWFLLLAGLRISMHLKLTSLTKHLGVIVFLLIWIPAAIAYTGLPSVMAGGSGYYNLEWLSSLAGPFGTGAILVFSMLIFLAVRFKWTPERLNAFIARLRPTRAEETKEDSWKDSVKAEAVPTPEPEPEIINEVSFDEPEEDKPIEETPEPEIEHEPLIIDQNETKEEAETPEELHDTEDLEIEKAEVEEEVSESELNRKLKEFGEYDPKLDLSKFKLPPIDLLREFKQSGVSINQEELEENKNKIVETLNNYKIEISKIKATIGPTVTLYEIVPAAGVRISKIKNLEDDIALSLAALGIRIIAPIPGKGTIGIEVPNTNPQVVAMRNMIKSEKFQSTDMELPIAFGKTISNETLMADLTKMPHLLMAGATGQGKSVGLNVILTSILYKKHPSQVKFILVDPKKVELTLFNKIERHYLAKLPDSEEAIITDTTKVIHTLNSLCIEMDNRYDLLKDAMVRNIKEYNHKFVQRKLNPENGHKYLPYIVLVIDEFADLIMTAGKEVETPIARLAQLARAIGIHLIVATQRPSVNVITGIIKANFPARIAFRVTSKIDSRTILDAGGAEQLIGKGDMLYSSGSDLIRIQCAFVDTPEVEEITDYIGNQKAYPEAYLLPEYVGEEGEGGIPDAGDPADRDALFVDAARVIVIHQQGSTSLLQRKLKLGYNRAGRIVDQLEAAGIIGPFEGSKARQVLIPDEMSLEQLLKNEQEKYNS
ncbi:DNA translocase FtsK 4TM domain-containing protein [Owenweeksia hongkongensis]|uniref:FtsK/SpoIIIE family DNA translocase n=1 Tax=Owenweeksia hongkongensis TaxID=253245 RepID=UPI003A936490